MADQMMKQWEDAAAQMRRRDLTKEEKAAIGEEILKGTLQPATDRRAQKNAIRRAIDSVRPGRKS
jgi:ribosome maturation protein Sdo1